MEGSEGITEGVTEGVTEGINSKDIADLQKIIDGYVEPFKFNKVISTLMEFYNKNKNKQLTGSTAAALTEIVRCFAPNFNTGL